MRTYIDSLFQEILSKCIRYEEGNFHPPKCNKGKEGNLNSSTTSLNDIDEEEQSLVYTSGNDTYFSPFPQRDRRSKDCRKKYGFEGLFI